MFPKIVITFNTQLRRYNITIVGDYVIIAVCFNLFNKHLYELTTQQNPK